MKNPKIAIFFGGKITRHLVLVRNAARKMDVDLDLVSYNNVCFDTETGKVSLRGKDVNDYDVLFFRTTGKHWEEVDLIINSIKSPPTPSLTKEGREPVVVDPLVRYGKPSYACKAWQMLALKKAGIEVPKTIYGSLWYLYECMNGASRDSLFASCECVTTFNGVKKTITAKPQSENFVDSSFSFPIILKGSGGDRGTRVFKANNLEELEKLVRDLRKSETEEGRRYMLQEYIENDGDYRVLVLGEKVLGVMKRSSQSKNEFRNNYSAGGAVEVADLPEEIKKLAVKSAKVCGLAVAGVDVMSKKMTNDKYQMSNDPKDYVILEVNKGPQFKGFMKATGIDVPSEIVKYLASLVQSP